MSRNLQLYGRLAHFPNLFSILENVKTNIVSQTTCSSSAKEISPFLQFKTKYCEKFETKKHFKIIPKTRQ